VSSDLSDDVRYVKYRRSIFSAYQQRADQHSVIATMSIAIGGFSRERNSNASDSEMSVGKCVMAAGRAV